MSDPLKSFVQQNREAFDYREPPAGVLLRLEDQIAPRPKLGMRPIWLIAAALLAGVVCTLVVFNYLNEPSDAGQDTLVQQPITEIPVETLLPVLEQGEAPPPTTGSQPPLAASSRATPPKHNRTEVPPLAKALAVRLADSSSASTRLAAILEIEQHGKMDDTVRSLLSETMNRDHNTNVRLAALDVLSHHIQDEQVADLLAASLTTQDDPLVQLGIVKVAGQLHHDGIEAALFAVIRNPYTFSAVKDEAYAVLLYQEKL